MNTGSASRHLARVLSLALAFTLGLIGVLGLAPRTALATDDIHFDPYEDTDWVVAPVEDDNITAFQAIPIAMPEGAKITNVKSSNKKVAKVEAENDYQYLWITYGHKCGSTTISCKVNGVTLSHKFTVKYTCPVTKFKVNGKSALKVFKKKNIFVTKKTLKNKKVSIKTKKGWVITKVDIIKKGNWKTKNVKNKRSYSVKISTIMPYDGVMFTIKNTKTGTEQTLKYRKYYDIRYAVAG